MEPKILSYGETGIIKTAFQKKTTSINLNEIEINRIALFDKTSYGNKSSFNRYIGYKHKGEALLSPLNVKLPQLIGYAEHFNNGDKLINFLVTDKELLKKYTEIWNKIKSLFKKEFDKKPLYDNKYISAKVNGTEFEHRILKANERRNLPIKLKNGSRHEYLSIILLDSILIYPEIYCSSKCYTQVFFKKCIYTKDKEAELLGKYIHYQ